MRTIIGRDTRKLRRWGRCPSCWSRCCWHGRSLYKHFLNHSVSFRHVSFFLSFFLLLHNKKSLKKRLQFTQSRITVGIQIKVVVRESPPYIWGIQVGLPDKVEDCYLLNLNFSPGQYGSVGWSIVLWTKGSGVQFLVRANTWVLGLVPGQGTYRSQPIDVSLSRRCVSPSLSLPPFPSL